MRYVLGAIVIAGLYFACRTPTPSGSQVRSADSAVQNSNASNGGAQGSARTAALVSFILD